MTQDIALSIIIPVYNGAATIGRLTDELFKLRAAQDVEVILVNDGSRDDSAAVCRSLLDQSDRRIVFVDLARNFGEHNAVMAGLRNSRGRWVIVIDDDFQNPPAEVDRLFEYATSHNYDVVYTCYDKKQHSFFRNLGSYFANRVADLMLDKPKGLYLSSFRCLSRLVVEAITSYDGPYPYIDGLILQVTQNIGTLRVAHNERTQGTSNYNLRRLVHLWTSILVNFSARPLHFSIFAGVIVCGLGFLFALQVIFEWITSGTPVGWSSLIMTILIFSGTQLMVIGVVGEYVGRTFITVNGKPQFIVRSISRSSAAKRGDVSQRDDAA